MLLYLLARLDLVLGQLKKVFSTEDKETVMEAQNFRAGRARCLIDMVIPKGERASQIMIDFMKTRDKHLCTTLGLISSPAGVGELRRVRSEFIQRVSYPVIKGLLDDLWQQKVFSTEYKDSVMEDKRFRADQARRLIDMVIGKGERASQIMIESMEMRDKHLYSTLSLIPSPAGDLKAVVKKKRIFSRGQDLSDKQLLQVAETLGQEWEQAAIHLELSITDLDVIKADRQTDVAIQKLKMLRLWKRRRPPGEATAQDLLRGLEDLEDLPVETRQLLSGNVLHPNTRAGVIVGGKQDWVPTTQGPNGFWEASVYRVQIHCPAETPSTETAQPQEKHSATDGE
ncbi:unnamed protein product [Gadus morhua 'NCC']